MKFGLLLFIVTGAFSTSNVNSMMKPVACSFFSYENAAKLIGQKAKGIDGEEGTEDGGRKWTCTFSPASGEDGPKVYFMILRNNSEKAAKKTFDDIRQSNKNHTGFEEWPGVADEAIAHTDGKGFQFLMLRNGMKTIRLKVNPAAGVSYDDTKAIAASLAMKLK